MVGRRESQADFRRPENLLPEITSELEVTVGDDGLRGSSVFKHLGKISSCPFLHGEGRFTGNKLDVFRVTMRRASFPVFDMERATMKSMEIMARGSSGAEIGFN